LFDQNEKCETQVNRESLIKAQSRCAELESQMLEVRQQLTHLPGLLQLLQIKDRIIMV
jgi:hypothetical protein